MTILAAVTLQGASGSPSDKYVNTFSLTGDGSETDAELDGWTACFSHFFNDNSGGQAAPLTGYMGAQVATTGHKVAFYERGQAPPNLPMHIGSFGFLAAPPGTALPAEVALCVSLQAAPVAGANSGPGPHLPARRRGRFYFGPLNQNAGVFSQNELRPAPALLADMEIALVRLETELAAASAPTSLEVWSEADGVGRVALSAWIDNAFDTQRRRGAEPTSRETFDLF